MQNETATEQRNQIAAGLKAAHCRKFIALAAEIENHLLRKQWGRVEAERKAAGLAFAVLTEVNWASGRAARMLLIQAGQL
jgi:hypothetical protein